MDHRRFQKHIVVRIILLLLLVLPAGDAVAGGEPDRHPVLTASSWPAADRLFQQDPAWRGGDGAHSVPLGGDRILWLFGDSFVATENPPLRKTAAFVRNSVAVQSGCHPEKADIRFYWRHTADGPASFFPEDASRWYWPGHGVVVQDVLILFLMRIRPDSNELGFADDGWKALRVRNREETPDHWQIQPLDTSPCAYPVSMGAASLLPKDGYLYAFCPGIDNPKAVFLARWSMDRIRAGDVSRRQWWAGETAGWLVEETSARPPKALFSGAQSEFSVIRDPAGSGLIQIQTKNFGAAEVVYRSAKHPWGPWSAPRTLYHPPEFEIPGILIYAGIAHPGLCGAPLIVTYVPSHMDPGKILADDALYRPRFVRCRIDFKNNDRSAP